jgi:hypothetical protein
MGKDWSGLIEMALVFGSVLVIAVVELLSLRRSLLRDAGLDSRPLPPQAADAGTSGPDDRSAQ